jgi:hypothetical protein
LPLSGLPAVEAVVTGTLTASKGHTGDPKDCEDHRCNPQRVKGKAASSKQKNQQEQNHYEHFRVVPFCVPMVD